MATEFNVCCWRRSWAGKEQETLLRQLATREGVPWVGRLRGHHTDILRGRAHTGKGDRILAWGR